ncbi:hypothetical protein, conserved [Trypanosoma brucei gambiense DAL972]|uniref:C3H1-type domain-containing protein n=1 Tax=Trypanosoma brucei gambiense (strain MHOM/CI/86/DAL972) TaxID=679716 RepID=C9ZNU9_TRYB9|nr:hypothetical protein, conserved [Trypanosoma brucei gambiense DAL972]CBH11077.1 hypothetical protein, conserved [Trypanosoma brucei gambiense DAL972]|eukprot:XP_011773364.1 hypothetical protein, conserved [Trypanosoma brucei gambiense DAL972]
MAKKNKHVEVKPSKYRTTLCEHYQRDGQCSYGDGCAFAHGEHQLHTEEQNMKLLRETGLRRVDGVALPVKTPTRGMPSDSPSLVLTPTMRRQPTFISLPSQLTAEKDATQGGEGSEGGSKQVYNSITESSDSDKEPPHPKCRSEFSASCSTENPMRYRHNPYGLYVF